MAHKMKVLNLYAGIGGNRTLWEDCEVTAVESFQPVADIYHQRFPHDNLIIADAHEYLLENFSHFDYIWASPPCQTHSQMALATGRPIKRYPDLKLYEEIIFLRHHFKGNWLVENVRPYYKPLISPTAAVGRHRFWSNIGFVAHDQPRPSDFINLQTVADAERLKDWLGIHFNGVVYYRDNHCPTQVLRNCVHPKLGLEVFLETAYPDRQRNLFDNN